jgi:FKBP-type peptidyl-prolyl cis-trans isomerase
MRLFTFNVAPLALFSLLPALVSAQQLQIEVTKEVHCTRKSVNGDTISVHYKGTLVDGTEFDESYNRGRPFKFTLGAHQVIEGWDQGLLGMCIGEGRKLTIPPSLGYGNQNMGKIPPGSTLGMSNLMACGGTTANLWE